MTNAEILSRMRKPKRREPVEFIHAWTSVLPYGPPPQFVAIGEQRIIPGRKFQFDWCWPELKVALDIDGGVFMPKSGHNTGKAITDDREKDWLAIQQGWLVIRWTTAQVGVENCERLLALLKGKAKGIK